MLTRFRRPRLFLLGVFSLVAAMLAVDAAVGHAQSVEPPSVERLFNNRAVSEDDHAGRADFDGAGNSLSAKDLDAAGWRPGQRLNLDSAELQWPTPRPGKPDNVRADGQRARVRGTGNAVSFLVVATTKGAAGKAIKGRGTISYTDGSHSTYTLRAPDWRGSSLAYKAVALPHINTHKDGQLTEKAKLYAVTVPVRKGREVASVVLPRDPGPDADLHIFDIAVRARGVGWSGSWSASTGGYSKVGPWRDQTLRLVVHSSVGGSKARVRLENTFASGPVKIGHASIAVRGEEAALRDAPVPLTFNGKRGTVMPAGARAVSDPVDFDVPPDTYLLISLHLPDPVEAAPVSSDAVQSSYLSRSGSGDRTGDTGGEAFNDVPLPMWPFLTGVDVSGGPGSVVALGDSITDGVGSTVGASQRWPDVLGRRLQKEDKGPRYGVLNHGISANRVVTDRYPGDGVSEDTAGVSAEHRLERDVLSQTNVRTVVLFEGTNDLRAGTSAEEVIETMRAIAKRVKKRGIRILAATVTPCEGYKDCTDDVQARRKVVNDFIRDSGGTFDGMLDFDAAVRDPEQPSRLLPKYDSKDHLHPGDDGLRAIGESIDPAALTG